MNKKWEAIAAVVAQAAKIETLVIGNCLQNLVLHFQIFQTGPFKFFVFLWPSTVSIKGYTCTAVI